MMHLKDEGIALIEEGYRKRIISDIEDAFGREKLRIPAAFLAILTKWGIMDSSGALDGGFLEDLLSRPIEELEAKELS